MPHKRAEEKGSVLRKKANFGKVGDEAVLEKKLYRQGSLLAMEKEFKKGQWEENRAGGE